MTNKLPAYFEKYFENKFGEVHVQIGELKLHVNDEISVIHQELKTFRRQMVVMWVALMVLLLLHIDQFGPIFLSSLRKFIGL